MHTSPCCASGTAAGRCGRSRIGNPTFSFASNTILCYCLILNLKLTDTDYSLKGYDTKIFALNSIKNVTVIPS